VPFYWLPAHHTYSHAIQGPWQYGQVRVLLDKEGYMRPNRENIVRIGLFFEQLNASADYHLDQVALLAD
jgi:hypothetical protein